MSLRSRDSVRSFREHLTLAALTICVALSVAGRAGAADEVSVPATAQRGPENAPVTIMEFSDFACPFCAEMPPVFEQLLKAYPDKVRVIFKHFPLPIHPQAPLAHEAALAAAAQGQFWPMHDRLFANQAHLTPEDLERYAAELQLDVDRFKLALSTHAYRPAMSGDMAEGAALGVNATPTFFINGRKFQGSQSLAALRGAVEQALAGPGASGEPEGFVAPTRLNVQDAPIRGALDAPVTIVAFSDLQCPFCGRANQTMHDLLKAYDGRVRLAFKHYPLDIHPKAPLAHQAALAAGEQGKFWEMHDALFADQSHAARPDLIAIAGKIGLDVARFETDLGSERWPGLVQRDKEEGEGLSIDGTPTFFINGVRVVGARPMADFRAVIDRELSKIGIRGNGLPGAGTPDGLPNRAYGSPEAPVTITWFGDLRSPLSADASRLIKQTIVAYGGRVRIVYRHLASPSRPESVIAYDAALAAGAQNRFWEMQDLLAANPTANTVDSLVALAKRLDLDQAKFESDIRSRAYKGVADEDVADAKKRDVRGTPAFFVDTERIDGVVPFDVFKQVVDRHLH